MYIVNINHNGKNVFSKKIVVDTSSIFGASLINIDPDSLEKIIFFIGFFIFLSYIFFLKRTKKDLFY